MARLQGFGVLGGVGSWVREMAFLDFFWPLRQGVVGIARGAFLVGVWGSLEARPSEAKTQRFGAPC